jgi:hypothetical protein
MRAILKKFPQHEVLNTRQVGARIRAGTLPPWANKGWVHCPRACLEANRGQTKCLQFWSTGDKVYCLRCQKWVVAVPVFTGPNVILDLRRKRRKV